LQDIWIYFVGNYWHNNVSKAATFLFEQNNIIYPLSFLTRPEKLSRKNTSYNCSILLVGLSNFLGLLNSLI
jgi:hypothetical protein